MQDFRDPPEDPINSYNKIFKDLKSQTFKIQDDDKISDLSNTIEVLESKNIDLEAENCKLKNNIQEIEKKLQDREKANSRIQQELHQSQMQYDQLVSKLLLSFNVPSIDKVFEKSQDIINHQAQISDLTKKLWETQLQFGNETMRSIENKLAPKISFDNEEGQDHEMLKMQIQQKESTLIEKNIEVQKLQTELNSIKIEDGKIQKEYAKLKMESQNHITQIERLENELDKVSDELTQLKLSQSKGLLEALNRLSVLKIFSKRLDPNFLAIEPSNILYSILDNLSMLFLSMSDMEIENQVIIECLGKVISVVQSAVAEIGKMTIFSQPRSDGPNEEELRNLLKQLVEKNEEIESLNEELLDLQENDVTPELASWKNKCRALEREIVQLKKNQLKSPDQQPKVMQRRPLQPISLPQTLP